MAEMKILRNDGGAPISVSSDANKLEINEPVSVLTNLPEVLRALPKLETLILYVTDYGKTDFTKSLAFLRGAKQLKNLSLRSMPHLEDCSALASCESLEWIGVSRHVSSVFDFGILRSLSSLKLLSIEMPTKRSLSEIAKAVRLESLELLGGFKLDNLEFLASLVNRLTRGITGLSLPTQSFTFDANDRLNTDIKGFKVDVFLPSEGGIGLLDGQAHLDFTRW